MLKRYLPLLFVVAVVIATAVVFLVFRDAQEPAVPAAQDGGEIPASTPVERGVRGDSADGVPKFQVESEAQYQATLAVLGTSDEEIEAWARSRGFPPATYTSLRGEPLEFNYRGASEDRIRELVAAGDFWAMQFLAARIGPEHPQQAIELYRAAIAHGSAYAAFKLGNLYQEIARWIAINQDDRAEVLDIARREDPLAYTALAWLMIAEYEAGLPPGAMSATLAGFSAPDDSISKSCLRAAGFLAEIQSRREAEGITVTRRKPPLAIELPASEIAGYCLPEEFPRTDFSDCETIRLVGDIGAVTGHRCR